MIHTTQGLVSEFVPDPALSAAPQLPVSAANEAAVAPVITAEVFIIPVEDGRYLVYAPLRRVAFVANSGVVNFLGGLREGFLDKDADPDGSLVEFLRQREILDSGPRPEASNARCDRKPDLKE
jgi:hypothetical protein